MRCGTARSRSSRMWAACTTPSSPSIPQTTGAPGSSRRTRMSPRSVPRRSPRSISGETAGSSPRPPCAPCAGAKTSRGTRRAGRQRPTPGCTRSSVVARIREILRREAVQHAREGDGLADVREAAYPRHRALDAEAEARVRERAVATEVEVPLECFLRQPVLHDRALEASEIALALSAAHDLAVSLGGEHVHVQRELRVLRVTREVEGLEPDRVAMNDDRAVELVRDDGLLVAAEVVADLRLRVPVLLKDVDGLVVRDAREGDLDVLQELRVALEDLELV